MKPTSGVGAIEHRIHVIREQKVMLDRDLAVLYGVTTFNLNIAVRRNRSRFPSDFMFQLSLEEYRSLRFRIGILERGRHSKYQPLAFTQEGIAMLSSVLRSPRAARVNIAIMRAFIRLKDDLPRHAELTRRLQELEAKIGGHDRHIQAIFEAIRQLMPPSNEPPRRIGFRLGARKL